MYYAENPSYLGFNSIGALRRYLRQYSQMNRLEIPFGQIFKQVKSPPINLCKIRGIKEPIYAKLNGSTGFVLGHGKDSITVASKMNIRLPYKYIPKHQGFSYKGVLKAKSDRNYWRYSIPRENVYKVNVCALAYSVGIKPRTYVQCHKLLGVDGAYLYLQIVEHNSRTVANKNIVSVHTSIETAKKELNLVIDVLIAKGLVLDKNIYMESFEGEMLQIVEDTPMVVEKIEDFL